jgi:hypothetical protein
MKRLFLALLGVGLLTSLSVAGQSKPGSIQGVWQVVEVTITGPGARTIAIPLPRPNLTIITGKHYSRVEVHSEGPRPVPGDLATASADELRAAWGPFVGEAGTYDVAGGNIITMHPIVAKNPAAMASSSFSTYVYKLDGDTLWVTEQRNQNGPIADPATVKAVRVE